MASAVIGSLRVNLGIDSAQFHNGLKNVQKDLNGVGKSMASVGARLAGVLATGVSVDAARQLIEMSTRIQNALKVTGLEGDKLTKVYGRLFASAQKNATPIEAMVELYSRLALSQKELGVSQEELLDFTDKIGVALRVSGKSAAEASGALLQLSQALGGGVVRAEEFNSILEGAQPIAQAAADGIAEAGGSIAKLRQLVIAGEVSSKAFFEGFQRGSTNLATKAANSEATISQSFVRLQNVLVDVAMRFDDSTGASRELTNFLNGPLTEAVQEIGQVFGSLGEGPIADFIGWINKAVDATVQGAADIGAALGTDQLGGNPYIGTGRIQQRIDDAFGGGTYTSPKSDRTPTSIDATKPNAVVKPISLKDYPIDADGKVKASAERVANSFDQLDGAVTRFVDNVVRAESGGNPLAKNPNSSATGVGQFIESTWLNLFRKHFPDRAKSMADSTILALRKDADISRTLIEAYARENAAILRQAGVSVNEAALHLAHFLGPQGAVSVLTAQAGTMISDIPGMGAAIRANPTILGGGKTREDVIAYAEARAAATAYAAANRDVAGSLGEADAAAQDLSNTYSELGRIGVGALQGLANALSDGKIEGRELLQIAIQIVEQLLAMQSLGGLGGGKGGGGASGGIGGAISGIVGSLFGFARGGSFKVGGAGGIDSQLVAFRASPNEHVAVTRGEQRHGAGGEMNINVNVDGANGDQHVIQLVRQGVAEGINRYDKQLNRSIGGKVANAQARQM